MKLFKKFKKNQKGFTLIELIIVIAIIGVLAAVVYPSLSGYIDKADETQVLIDGKAIATAIDALNAEGTTVNAANIEELSGVDVDATGVDLNIDANDQGFDYTVDGNDDGDTEDDEDITVGRTDNTDAVEVE